MVRIYEGFVTRGPMLPGGPEQYFDNISISTFVMKSCLFNAQSLILDAIVVSVSLVYRVCLSIRLTRRPQIYRAYIVWQNFLAIIFPSLLWVGLLGGCLLPSSLRPTLYSYPTLVPCR